jgi:hypothetical protein
MKPEFNPMWQCLSLVAKIREYKTPSNSPTPSSSILEEEEKQFNLVDSPVSTSAKSDALLEEIKKAAQLEGLSDDEKKEVLNHRLGEVKRTPLHHAAEKSTTLIRLLLELGADPSIEDKDGKAPQAIANEKRIKWPSEEIAEVDSTGSRTSFEESASPTSACSRKASVGAASESTYEDEAIIEEELCPWPLSDEDLSQ